MTTTTKSTVITVETTVNAPIGKVWKYWSEPQHITKWSFASPDWHTPEAENDLRTGGKFRSVMAAKDGSMSFEFGGEYTDVKNNERIAYVLSDGRKVDITFSGTEKGVKLVENFEAENQNPIEMQKEGWQAILDNFKKYTEEN